MLRKHGSRRFTMPKGTSAVALEAGGGNFMQHLAQVKANNGAILTILEKQGVKDDVQELVQSCQTVHATLQKVFERCGQSTAQNVVQSKLLFDSVDKLSLIANEYLSLVEELSSKIASGTTTMLQKTLASSRGRRKLEQLSSSLLVESSILEELSETMLKEHDANYQKLPQARAESAERVEILDKAGLALWSELFGPTAFMVNVNQLVKGLTKALNVTMNTPERKILLQVLDPSNTNTISSIRWNEFLKGFGPMSECLVKLEAMLAQPWFHGFLSREDSTKMLEVEAQGTFMVRFSSTKPGSFSLAHTMARGEVNHVIINTRVDGFTIKQDDGTEQRYGSIVELIDAYKSLLQKPYKHRFARQLWWHGDMSGDEASELLKDKKAGTFIVRFSASQRGCFATSYVGKNNVIEKGLIVGSPQGYQLNGKLFQSMEEIVASLIAYGVFTEPYKNTTNEVQNKMRHKIVSEMASTETTYVAALKTLCQLFLAEFRNNSKVKPADTVTVFSNCEKVYALHDHFLKQLCNAITPWDGDESKLGNLFLELNAKLPETYSPYVNNYSDSIAKYNELLKNKPVTEWMQRLLERQPKENYQNSLMAFLIMPIQRIPRYILLLKDLLKHTPGAHVDYDALSDAFDGVKENMLAINEGKRETEQLAELRELAEKITGLDAVTLAVRGRKLVKQGPLVPLENDKVKSRDYYTFLFSDIVVITKTQRGGKAYKYKELVPLQDSQVVSIPDAGKAINLLRVVGLQSDLTLAAESAEDKEAWLKAFKDVVSKLGAK